MSEHSKDEGGRKPDHLAYNVSPSRDGKVHWEKVGAAWQHRDGRGFDIDLHSVPVNGRVTLREMREERMDEYAKDRAAQEPAPEPAAKRSRSYAR